MSLEMIRDIFKAASFFDNEHFQSVQKSFAQNLSSRHKDKVERVYENSQSDLERIEQLQKYFEWKPIPLKYFERFQKSEELSCAFREVGNTAYKAKDISNAFRGYNLALGFAPTGSEAEGLAYSNRSALFMFIMEFEKALLDLEYSLNFNLNENVRQKLYARKAKCESMEVKSGSSFGEDGRRFFEERFATLKSPNVLVKGAGSYVKIEFSPNCGRRLVATENIPAGSPMVVDHGYVSALDRLLNWDTEHCAFCTKPLLGGIPNPFTTFGLYCNESCLSRALKTVSKNEHKYLPYLHSTQALNDETVLILRILSKAGPQDLYDLWSTGGKFKTELEVQKIPGINVGGAYDPGTYLAVYNLIPHRIPTDFKNLEKGAEFKSIFLANLLDDTTDFFASKAEPGFKSFVSSLILRHFESLEFNILSLCEWRTISGPLSQPLWIADAKLKSRETKTRSYASGVFPLVALCNHSCDPNAIFVKGTKVDFSVLLSSRQIRQGEEICISYKAPFTRLGFQERQEYLAKNYKFECNCFACRNCFSVDSMVKNPVLVDKCSDSGSFEAKLMRLGETEAQFEVIERLIRDEEYLGAFKLLIVEADFLSNFEVNFESFQICQDLFRRVVVHIMHL